MKVFKRVLPYDYSPLLTKYVNDLNVVVEPLHCEALTEIIRELMSNVKGVEHFKTLLEEAMFFNIEEPRIAGMFFYSAFSIWTSKISPFEAWNEITDYIDWKLFVGGATASYADFNDHKVELGRLAVNWREFNDWYLNDSPEKDDFIAIFKGSEPNRVRLDPSFSSSDNNKGWGWL